MKSDATNFNPVPLLGAPPAPEGLVLVKNDLPLNDPLRFPGSHCFRGLAVLRNVTEAIINYH